MRTLILYILCLITFQSFSQPSYSTNVAIRILDDKDQPINYEQFIERYQVLDIYGNKVSNDFIHYYVRYDKSTKYFVFYINTIGPRFSMGLETNGKTMLLYIPFHYRDEAYYAIDLRFKEGKYLLDFNTANTDKIRINSNIPYAIIEKVNWKKQQKQFFKSEYANDLTYD